MKSSSPREKTLRTRAVDTGVLPHGAEVGIDRDSKSYERRSVPLPSTAAHTTHPPSWCTHEKLCQDGTRTSRLCGRKPWTRQQLDDENLLLQLPLLRLGTDQVRCRCTWQVTQSTKCKGILQQCQHSHKKTEPNPSKRFARKKLSKDLITKPPTTRDCLRTQPDELSVQPLHPVVVPGLAASSRQTNLV